MALTGGLLMRHGFIILLSLILLVPPARAGQVINTPILVSADNFRDLAGIGAAYGGGTADPAGERRAPDRDVRLRPVLQRGPALVPGRLHPPHRRTNSRRNPIDPATKTLSELDEQCRGCRNGVAVRQSGAAPSCF